MLNKTKPHKQINTLLLLATLAVLVGHFVLPERRVLLHPQPGNDYGLYGYVDPKTGQSSRWLDKSRHLWTCNFKPEHPYGCGSSIGWGGTESSGKDFSGFDAIELSIGQQGDARRLRLSLRNYNEAYSTPGKTETDKHLYVLFHTSELIDGTLRVELSEFSVSRWWVLENSIHSLLAKPEFDSITNIGVELADNAEQTIQIKKIELVGPWVTTESLLYGIIIFWMVVFLAQGAIRFYKVYRSTLQGRHRVKELLKKQESLEVEKQYLRNIAKKDPLTGICNRTGLQSQLETLLDNGSVSEQLALMVLDLDNFKKINDNYGHDFGDKVIKSFVEIVSNNIREQDLFVRWGGEEFLLLCDAMNQKSILEFAEKLRVATANTEIESTPELNCTVSIGVTTFSVDDDFETAFRRADHALIKAKKGGRNRVEYEI